MKKKVLDVVSTLSPNLMIAINRRHENKSKHNSSKVAIAKQYPLTKEQKRQVDELFVANYGKKVDYFWHQYYAAHSGKFDCQYFPELLYIPEFEAFQNHDRSAVYAFSDKNLLPLAAKAAKVRMPQTIVSCTNGILRDSDNDIITPVMASELVERKEKCFIKPSVASCSGQGCVLIDRVSDILFEKNVLKISNQDNCREYKGNFIIQEVVTCHESIKTLYSGSVNTFRVITYLWKGKVERMPIIIRIGQGGHYLDNAHQGGMFCAVHDDGTMGSHAITEFNDQFSEHPDSHTVFSTHKIEYVDRIIVAAKRMHTTIPQLGVVNWDFTIDASGEPVLIEANTTGGSIWLPQMAHGSGAFGERTAEVLQWLRFMKKLKPKQRKQFGGGEMA